LLNYKLISYGYSQLLGQIKIINSTYSKEDYKLKYQFGLKEKAALENLQSILKFAESKGFYSDKNYQEIVSPNHPRLVVASASEQYYVKPYLWKFPFIGEVPYKGFFNRSFLYKELFFLKNNNLDFDTGQVNAYSTLGIWNDPIMPSMLNSDEDELAETIFHELVHKYYFEPTKQHINETLAQAFGEELTLNFLEKAHGKNSPEINRYRLKINKRDLLQVFFREQAKELNKFYESVLFLKAKNKIELKQKRFREMYLKIYQSRIVSKQRADDLVHKIHLSKNAFFSDYIVYFSNKDSLKHVLRYKHQGKFMNMIEEIKRN
jgi:predicted aminopeptidase